MKISVVLVVVLGALYVHAEEKCHGSPKMFNGKRCATTTNYVDGHKGACGCGPDNNDNQYDWNRSGFNTAPSQHFFDSAGGSWCGHNCGKCVRLTTTGGFVPGQGGHVSAGQSKVFMVTNLCPNEYPNLSWCSQSSQNGYKNQFGYSEHFDLENGAGQLSSIGWAGKNPEVTWEFADCNQGHNEDHRTPNNGMYHQCFCGKHGKK